MTANKKPQGQTTVTEKRGPYILIVNKVAADIIKVLSAPEVKARLAPQGVDVVTNSPQAMAQLVREDHARWGKIIKAAGIKAD